MDINARVLGLLISLLAAGEAGAATFTVGSLAQAPDATPGDGICETASGNGVCTLEAAIQESNATPGIVDTINIPLTGTIRRDSGSGVPACISESVMLNGPASGTLVLDGNNAVRPLCISRGGVNGGNAAIAVTVARFTLTRGRMTNPSLSSDFGGGGLSVCGREGSTQTLSDLVITDSTSNDYGGGGMYVCADNTATLQRIRIANNRSDSQGAGLFVEGTVAASDLMVQGNQVVTRTGNTALLGGGGIAVLNASSGTGSTFMRTTVINNGSNVPNGVGAGVAARISTFAELRFSDSRIEGNVNATTHGGGLGINGGRVALSNVSIAENRAAGDGGGVYLGTEADGSNLRFGQLAGRQLMVFANTAANGAGFGAAAGNVAPSTLVRSTVVFGLVSGSGGAFGPNTAGVFVAPFHSNLVAENYVIGNAAPRNCAAAFNITGNSSGYHLSDDASCGFTQPTDQQGVPAGLVNPADKGGFYRSVGLSGTSAAIDRGHPSLDVMPDARAAPVTDGDEDGSTRRDVGAYEFGGFGAVRFTTAGATVFEGDAQAIVQAVRYGDLAVGGSATLATENGTAQAGSDYTATTATLDWATGDGGAKSFTIPLTADGSGEADETLRALVRGTSRLADVGRIAVQTITLRDGSAAGAGGGGTSGGGGSTGGTAGGGTSGGGSTSGGATTGGSSGGAMGGSTVPGGTTSNHGNGGGGSVGAALLMVFALASRRRRR